MSKKFINIILFAIIGSLFVGCKDKIKEYKPTTTIIEGTINNPLEPVLVLNGRHTVKTPVDQNGVFYIQTQLTTSDIYTIEHGGQQIRFFIQPGDHITLNTDSRSLIQSATFKGNHANENNYIVDLEQLVRENEPQDYVAFYSQKEGDFLAAVDNRLQLMVNDKQEYQKKNGTFDEVFSEILVAVHAYDAANLKLKYPDYYRYYNPDSVLVLSDTYDSFLQNLDVDNDENLYIPTYKEFASLYLDFHANMDTLQKETPLTVRKFDSISSLFTEPQIKSYLYHSLMKQTIDQSINEAAPLLEKYQKLQKNPEYLAEINETFSSWSHLMNGKPAPTFEYQTPQGKKISLNSFKGKLVYIDIWATWCGPCLRELPSLQALEDKYGKSNDIVFVSVSIDQDKSNWLAMVKNKNMGGVQLLADADWSSKIINDYRISGIPRFILVGKEGEIIDANAPRPSSSDIIPLIEKSI